MRDWGSEVGGRRSEGSRNNETQDKSSMLHLPRWQSQRSMIMIDFLSAVVFQEAECYSIYPQRNPAQSSHLFIPKATPNDEDAFCEEFPGSSRSDVQSHDKEHDFVQLKANDNQMVVVEHFYSTEKLPVKRTKAQIKKLRFLMMQDVENLIQNKDPSAPTKALENIKRLQKLYKLDGSLEYKPNVSTYNLLVRAYAKSGASDAPIMAEKVLNKMMDVYEKTGDYELKPTIITYTEVIDAYARSDERDSAVKAEQILSQIMKEDVNNSSAECIAATSITFDAVIHGWAKRGNREGAKRAEDILEQMETLRQSGNLRVQPTQYSFATVISAWKRIGGVDSAKRAQYILDRMNQFSKSLIEEGEDEYAAQLFPDVVMYNSVIDAWACSGDPTAGTRSETLLNKMDRNGVHADSITFGSVINSHAESGHMNAAKAAEKVLKRMEIAANASNKCSSGIIPRTQTYNQVLKAYSKSKLSGAAKRAELFLKYMLRSKNKNI